MRSPWLLLVALLFSPPLPVMGAAPAVVESQPNPSAPQVTDAIPTPLFGHYACFEGMTREQKVALAREFLQKALKDKTYPMTQKGVDLTKTDQANCEDTLFAVVITSGEK